MGGEHKDSAGSNENMQNGRDSLQATGLEARVIFKVPQKIVALSVPSAVSSHGGT